MPCLRWVCGWVQSWSGFRKVAAAYFLCMPHGALTTTLENGSLMNMQSATHRRSRRWLLGHDRKANPGRIFWSSIRSETSSSPSWRALVCCSKQVPRTPRCFEEGRQPRRPSLRRWARRGGFTWQPTLSLIWNGHWIPIYGWQGQRSSPSAELLPHLTGKAPELVVLSACETAVSRVTTTPDEFLGFPAALLHAGARTVLATLWPVDDEATAVLVGRFYAELSSPGTSPAEALRRAQTWLRTVTESELRKLRSELCKQPNPVGELAALSPEPPAANPESRPFAEPYYWAAFTVVGH